MSKELTWGDIMDMSSRSDTMEQQLLLLSRFFKISEADIKNMAMDQVYSMTDELNQYMEQFEGKFIPDPSSPNFIEKIQSRSQILDFGDHEL